MDAVGECTVLNIIILFYLTDIIIDTGIKIKRHVVGVFLVAQRVPSETVVVFVDDGGVGGAVAEDRIEGRVKGNACGGFAVEQLVALVGKAVIEAAEGEFSGFVNGVCRDGVGG